MTLGELVHSRSVENPANTVLFCGGETISWEELDKSTSRLAGWFLDQGLRPGDRVAIHWSNRIETVQLFLGLWKAGLIAVTVNTRLKPPEIAYILEHSQARMCFSEPALAQSGALHELPRLEPADVALPEVDPNQPAVIMYTSGTTARPKGVTHTHRTLIGSSGLTAVALGHDSGDRTLLTTPMMHVSGLFFGLLSTVYFGGSVVLLPTVQPAAVLDAMEKFHCTSTFALPSMMLAVVEEQARKPRDARSMRLLSVGGDSVPVSLRERVRDLFSTPLQELYGMTEGGVLILNLRNAIRPGSLGMAQKGVEARVVDLDDRDVPEGETGELVVRSPGNCIGYWKDPHGTEALLRSGWLHTGDLASRDGDGYYWFQGRKKEIIIRGGSKISPQEVEEALYQHASVTEVGVVGMPDPVLGERVVAIVSVRPEDAPSEEALIAFAQQRLADYKTPERVLFIEQLPKGPTGKVQRRALKEMLIAQSNLIEQCAVAGI